uniref:Ig-like domain-containing protein n=1 Tax=Poecilia mexicana TaxID=48701 RepID=A0A3B3Z2M8_9TELE
MHKLLKLLFFSYVPTLQTREGSDVMLPCSPSGKNDLTYQVFDWEKDDEQQVFLYHNGKHYNNGLTGQNENFKNRVEFFQDQLQFGNASIRIKNTKLTDSGNYSCTFPLLQPPGQKFYMNLVVLPLLIALMFIIFHMQLINSLKRQCLPFTAEIRIKLLSLLIFVNEQSHFLLYYKALFR